MRMLLVATICVLPMMAADEPGPPRTYMQQMFGTQTYVRAGAVTAWGLITDRPEGWGRDADGAGKRFVSSYGRHMISTSVRVGVGTIRNEDQRYFPAEQTGFGGRLRHAVFSTLIVRKNDSGDRTMAVGRISGAYTGAFVSRTWHPERYQTFSSGLTSGTLSLGLDAAMNVVREFWPKRRR
jgi:hypothetical protein